MPVDSGTIYSEIRIALDKLNGDLKKVDASFDKLNSDPNTNGEDFDKNNTKAFNNVSVAGIAAAAAIGAAFVSAISGFAKFEQAIANVQSVTRGTAEEMKFLEEAAKQAGSTTRFTATDAANALYNLSSAGLDATQSVDALDGVLTLAGATQSDLAFTAETLTSVISQYSLEASEAGRVSNVFASAIQNSKATMDRLANAFRQVGPVAAGFGLSVEETTGNLEALFNAGFKGESAGRALKSILADLGNESSLASSKLRDLGIGFEEVNPATVGLTGAIERLQAAGLDTAQTLDIFGKVAGPQAASLLRTGADAIRDYTDAVTGTNAAAESYAIQNDTLAGSIDSAKSAIEGASFSLIEKLAPAIRAIVDGVSFLLRAFTGLPGEIQAVVGVVGGAAAAFGVLNGVLGVLGVTLTGPIGLIAGFVALTVGLLGFANAQNKKAVAEIKDEFVDFRDELELTEEEFDNFAKKVSKIKTDQGLIALGAQALGVKKNFKLIINDTDKMLDLIDFMADRYKLSREEVIRILESQKGLSAETIKTLDETKNMLSATRRVNSEHTIAKERTSFIGKTVNKMAANYATIRRNIAAITETAIKESEERERQADLARQRADALARNLAARKKILETIEAERIALKKQLDAGLIDQKEYTDKRIESEEKFLKESIEKGEDETDAFKESLDERNKLVEEKNEEAKESYDDFFEYLQENWQLLLGVATDVLTSISTLQTALAEQEINQLEDQLQAELEAAGLAEQSNVEKAEAKLQKAEETGDQEAILEAQNALKKAEIEEKFQKKIAEVKYKSDVSSWQSTLLLASAKAAEALIVAGASAQWPFNLPALGAAAVVNGTNIAAITASKPQPPSFATGGIVDATAGGANIRVAENGSGEVMFNTGGTGEAFTNQMASAIARQLTGLFSGQMSATLQIGQDQIQGAILKIVESGSNQNVFTLNSQVVR